MIKWASSAYRACASSYYFNSKSRFSLFQTLREKLVHAELALAHALLKAELQKGFRRGSVDVAAASRTDAVGEKSSPKMPCMCPV
jgi:hypothetical protein